MKRKQKKFPAFAYVSTKQIDKYVSKLKKVICSMFLEAVINHDRKAILEIADAVWFLKGKIKVGEQTPMSDRNAARRSLLTLMIVMEKEKLKPPILMRDVAEYVNIERYNTPEDGYSELRKLCKEVNFPLTKSRQIRRK